MNRLNSAAEAPPSYVLGIENFVQDDERLTYNANTLFIDKLKP